MSVQIAACESYGQVVRIAGADVPGDELWLVAARGRRAATVYKSESAVSEERCFAKRSFSTAGRRPETTTAAGPTAKDLVGPAHATLSGGDVDAARSVHRHSSVGGAKYHRIADRYQGVAIEHEGSYILIFF